MTGVQTCALPICIYYGLTQTAEDILSTFLKRSAGKEQPATYEDRKAQDTEATLNSVTYAIYVNNIETGMTTTPDGMIEVSSVLPGYGVANYALDEQALYLHTAAVSNLKLEIKTSKTFFGNAHRNCDGCCFGKDCLSESLLSIPKGHHIYRK